MRVFDFNETRKALLDPSPKGIENRKEIAEVAGVTKGIFGLVKIGTAALSVIGLLAMFKHPIIGGTIALVSGGGFAASHEVKAIAQNTETMTKGDTAISNLKNRVIPAWSEELFVDHLTKDTWIIGPYFGSTIVNQLKRDR